MAQKAGGAATERAWTGDIASTRPLAGGTSRRALRRARAREREAGGPAPGVRSGTGPVARHASGAHLPVRAHDGGEPPGRAHLVAVGAQDRRVRQPLAVQRADPPRRGRPAGRHGRVPHSPGAYPTHRDVRAGPAPAGRLLADSLVISVDPTRLDTEVLAAEYWRELSRTEGWTTTRTPALPNLERAAPGRALIDIGRGHLAAAWRLGWRCGPGHAARGREGGRAA